MDCIAVASSGIENVVASCGTSLTEGQIRLLARYSRRIVVNYDPDSAGVAATERSLGVAARGRLRSQGAGPARETRPRFLHSKGRERALP